MLFFETPARSYEEVAKQLGLANGSVGLTRRRCLDKMQKELTAMGL
jgi:DNA-directed RNA polymerase specialized sigma24 family protein